MVEDVGAFGALLRAGRRSAGLSQQELAERSGMSVRAISDLERGRTKWPYPDSVQRLADALQLAGQARTGFIAAVGRRLAEVAPTPAVEPPVATTPTVTSPANATTTAADPAPATPELATAESSHPAPIPKQLPAPVRNFVGREAELTALTEQLDQVGSAAPKVLMISAIGGTAGVGKTALAVAWAHRIADRFPDGQLYVNLRGYDTDRPMRVTEALAGFLRALGMPGSEIPSGADERAAAYRSRIAGLHMLVVLDNARKADQIRPLLPGTASCAVVITSRDTMAGLVARDGAARVDLDLLPQADAVGLLRELIGARAADDSESAATMATRCCRLPLALRVAAELATLRPEASLADLSGELADLQNRLDLLDAGGDARTAVRAVFSWSYPHLDPDAARAFRLVGLHPGTDFDAHAAAALTGTILPEAYRLLDRLARAYLIQPAGPGRYGMHDLLRVYARELAAEDGEAEQDAALTRLFEYYLYSCATAMDTLVPGESESRPRIPRPTCPIPQLASESSATAWLEGELPNLVATTVHMAENTWPEKAAQISALLYRYLDMLGRYPEAVTIHGHARRAAARIGDLRAEAAALRGLGVVDWRLGRYRSAAGRYRQALQLSRQAGDRVLEASMLGNLGLVELRQSRYRSAAGWLKQALALAKQVGDCIVEARTLDNLGGIELRLGRYQAAADRFQQALLLHRKSNDRIGEALTLANLGLVDLRLGQYASAADRLQQALAVFRATGAPSDQADALARLGLVDLRLGNHQQAVEHLEEALTLSRQAGHRDAEAEVLNTFGEVYLADGRPELARVQHTTALNLAAAISDEYEQARADAGLARAYLAEGDLDRARWHQQESFSRYSRLGMPEAHEIRTLLPESADEG